MRGARTCGGAAARGRSGSSRRHSYRDLVQKEARIRAGGRLCLADGSIASVCTGRVSLVPALAGAVLAVGLDAANHHLDGEHFAHLLRVAPAYDWTSLGGSWLDHAAGIRSRCSGRYDHRAAPTHAAGNVPLPNGLDRDWRVSPATAAC